MGTSSRRCLLPAALAAALVVAVVIFPPRMLSSVFARGMPALAASAAYKVPSPASSGGKLRQAVAPSPSPVPPLFPGRYLVATQIVEGFGAWSDGVWEMLDLAMQLNRTLVEPCVRNGCIEPCRCGHVRPVPPFDPAWAAGQGGSGGDAGVDPLLLPYIDDPCKIDARPYKRPKTYAAPSYPLSAYIDMEAVKAKYPPGLVVPYQEWCEAYNTSHAGDWDASALRWKRPYVYCGDMQEQYCDGTDFFTGDFVFGKEVAFRSGGDGAKAMQILRADDADTVFLWRYYRALFQRAYSMPSLPINPWHVAAVKRFIAERMGGPDAPFVAFHWRSEHVKDEDIVPCAQDLANISARLPHVVPVGLGGSGAGKVAEAGAGGGVHHFPVSHAVLVADMPSPNTKNVMWTDYVNGKGEARQHAMQVLMDAGMYKYDATVSNVDAGVLSLRDYLFSVMADVYVTCQGEHWKDCHGCFRAGSNIVFRIVRDRREASKPSMDKWFNIGPSDVPPAPP